ncbi:hypothetical protein A5727_23790 [Mycobacterium sp. ACS4331]|nr:hypothetical protein A5727_23790 [Mycobacterium sp. ACS4331]
MALSTSVLSCQVEIPKPGSFQGAVKSRSFADLEFVDVAAGRHAAYRDRGMVQPDDEPYFLAALQVSGEFRVSQDGRTAVLRPGRFCFFDSCRPVAIEADDDYRGVCVKIPYRVLDYPRKNLASLTATAVDADRGVPAAVWPMLITLKDRVDTIGCSGQYKLAHGVVNLVESMLSSVDPSIEPAYAPRSVTIEQIKGFIEERLADDELSPKMVAEAHFISVRQLHYLFESTGMTMSAWVRDRRLERCQADLVDPKLSHLPISAIARKWGFLAASHFTQVFKGATGMTPRQFRAAGRA